MIVVFLDRDGVINRNSDDYVKTCDELIFLPRALEGLAKLKAARVTTVVVSNQAGIGRGLIDPAELERINRKILQAVSECGGEIAGFYYCPHRKDEGCGCRKPNIGLFKKAGEDLGFDPSEAYFVGDAESDVEAGHRLGCKTVLVLTGRTSIEDVQCWEYKPAHIAADLPSAVDWILAAH